MKSEPRAPGVLIVLSAPSGAGKTTLAHAVIDALTAQGRRAGFSVSYTTRAPRKGERAGVDYHFVAPEDFLAMAEQGEMLEHAEVFGRHYGTGLAATEEALARGEIVFLDIDWQGARQVKARLPQHCVSVFILPPSRESLRLRLQGRGQDDEAVIAARMTQAQSEMAHHDEFDFVLVNDRLELAVEQLLAICLGRPLPGCEAGDHEALVAELLA